MASIDRSDQAARNDADGSHELRLNQWLRDDWLKSVILD